MLNDYLNKGDFVNLEHLSTNMLKKSKKLRIVICAGMIGVYVKLMY